METQVMSLALTKGINTKTDPKQVMTGELLTLENGIFISPSEIKKRDGYSALTQTVLSNPGIPYPVNSPISSGNSLGVLNDSLALLDDFTLYGYSENDAKWVPKGAKTCCSTSSSSVSNFAISQSSPKVALDPASGIALLAWDNYPSGGFYISYFDTKTNMPLSNQFVNVPATTVIPFVLGSHFYIVIENRFTNSLSYVSFPISTFSPKVGPVSLAALGNTFNGTVTGVQNTSNIFLLFDFGGTNNLVLGKYDSTFTLVASVAVNATSNQSANLMLDSVNSRIWVFYADAGVIKFSAYDFSLNLVVSPTVSSILVAANALTAVMYSATSFVLYGGITPSTSNTAGASIVSYWHDFFSNTSTNALFAYTVQLAGNAFTDSSGNVYVPVTYKSTLQPTNFILREVWPLLSAISGKASVAAKYAPLAASQAVQNSASNSADLSLFSVIPIATDKFLIPYVIEITTTISNGVISGNYNVSLLSLSFKTKEESVLLANNLNTTGGIVTIYDGLGVAESGFNLFPDLITISAGATPGNILPGSYEYQVTYQWTDNFGNIHRSAPSAPINYTFSSPANQMIDLLIPVLTLSEPYKGPNIVVTVYRTQNNGTTFFKSATGANSYSGGAGGFITVTDNTSDVDLVGNEQLYTNGGEVENLSPPASVSMTSFKNRIILVPSESPFTWWYSKQVIPQFPVEFSDLFIQNIDQKGGPIFKVETMDDKLIFFKESLIFYVIGDGPAPSGANNDFSYPQVISTDVGCIDNIQPVVLTPAGLIFKSQKGIYLLDRSLQTSYLGAKVERYNSQTITSAFIVPNTTQVRFTLSNNTALVYDYFVNGWSVFTNISAVDSLVYKQKWVYLDSSGQVHEEDPSVFTDNGTAIVLKLVTGFLSMAQVQGFERIKKLLILGDNNTVNNLNVSFAYDFKVTQYPITTISLDVSSTEPFQVRSFLPFQKCETVQITISDSPQGTVTGSFDISNLALEVGVKKGPNKITADKSYG